MRPPSPNPPTARSITIIRSYDGLRANSIRPAWPPAFAVLPMANGASGFATLRRAVTVNGDASRKPLGFAEVNYALMQNGFVEGTQVPPPDPTDAVNLQAGRVPVSIGGTLYFTMLGYKILQAQSPAM